MSATIQAEGPFIARAEVVLNGARKSRFINVAVTHPIEIASASTDDAPVVARAVLAPRPDRSWERLKVSTTVEFRGYGGKVLAPLNLAHAPGATQATVAQFIDRVAGDSRSDLPDPVAIVSGRHPVSGLTTFRRAMPPLEAARGVSTQ